jgi:hypothetical protein
LLRGLVSTTEQDDQHARTLDEIDPVTRSVVDPDLTNAFTDVLDVTEIAKRKPAYPDVDARDS